VRCDLGSGDRSQAAPPSRRHDKETPLWDPHSQVVCWWTSTEVDGSVALSVTYNGRTNRRPKSAAQDYLGFRAVRVVAATPPTGVR